MAVDPWNDLANRIEGSFPGVRTNLGTFPSGAYMLDVIRGDRFFQMAWSPTDPQFGVDEVLEDEGWLLGYRFCYPDFAPAAERLMELVSGQIDVRQTQEKHAS